MKKIGSLFIGGVLVGAVVVTGVSIWNNVATRTGVGGHVETTKYGAFLAAHHAIYTNDFESAKQFSAMLEDENVPVVQNVKMAAAFLSGDMPENVSKEDKKVDAPAQRFYYDAHLVNNNLWNDLYARHKDDKSALVAPLRIWSSIAINHKTEALRFVDSLDTNNSWKLFVRGQIYAETGDIDKAATAFSSVRPDFMNINDYMYVMSFYRHNNLTDLAEKLHDEFTSLPGGMFMAAYDNIPDWSQYAGIKNELASSLIQSVSHSQVMMYSDLSILLLRFAQMTGDGYADKNDAINYYIGQFFFNNGGDYKKYFSEIKPSSPFYPFAMLRIAEGSGDVLKLRRVLRAHPMFVPAINKLVSYYVAHGERRAALRVINRAMDTDGLSDENHAFFLKHRAQIYFAFGDFNKAQSDLHAAADVLIMDAEMTALQAKLWAAQNREIEEAYEYAMRLVRFNPSDVFAWDVLGRVVAVREGTDAALDILTRVGEVANTCSSLFEHLGDLYVSVGNEKLARDAYMRAIELADDGLVVIPNIKHKLRKIK